MICTSALFDGAASSRQISEARSAPSHEILAPTRSMPQIHFPDNSLYYYILAVRNKMEAHRTEDKNPLLGDVETAPSYGTHEDMHEDDGTFTVMKHRGWSFQESRRLVVATTSADHPEGVEPTPRAHHHTESYNGVDFYLYCLVYAIVNVIISAPGLYGYAAVIFNNPVFNNHMNALSKLVIFSSLVHQLGFFLFSSLDFAIGTVQDAGLIFLSGMANIIANEMSADGHSEEEIVSTTLVLLSLGTAALGLVLVLMGKFRLADVVSYLPMPGTSIITFEQMVEALG